MSVRPIPKETIRERLKYKQKWVTTSITDIFDSDVSENKFRHIVKVIICGDGQADRTLTLYKKKEDGSYEVIIENLHVAAPEVKEIPQGVYDIEDPIITLEGGTNLAGKVSGNSLSVTAIYWDA